jgi:hypothetical protein
VNALLVAAGRVRTIAAKLDLVSRLFAVLAAILAETAVGLDDAFTRRMGAFR